jgi:zinc D-Ala-D-Ala carboxypeptidase
MQLSKHLTLKEVTKSNTATRLGISNTPTPVHLENLKTVAEKIFEPVRNWWGKPIGVSSGYRSKALNTAVKGSSTSQHCSGEALDIDADIFDNGITNAQIFHFIKDHLDFDQLIWEFGTDAEPDWVHVSYRADGKNRKKLTRALPNGKYIDWK